MRREMAAIATPHKRWEFVQIVQTLICVRRVLARLRFLGSFFKSFLKTSFRADAFVKVSGVGNSPYAVILPLNFPDFLTFFQCSMGPDVHRNRGLASRSCSGGRALILGLGSGFDI